MLPCLAIILVLCSLPATQAAEVDFVHEIVPILRQQCSKCHGGHQKEGGFSLNTRESLLAGGESGVAVVSGKADQGELLARITSDDEFARMPPEGDPLSDDQIKLLQQWIAAGLPWEPGFTFGESNYEPPLKSRRPGLPPAVDGRTNPIDRILDAQFSEQNRKPLQPLSDEAFLRRVYLDLIGLLPSPEERTAFLDDPSANKRAKLVRELLERDVDYTEHWLTFWNDLLRNDYAGTGFITGGRKQISKWLYNALVTNMPYDQFIQELIAPPTSESAGFSGGIQWRGEVSAGQSVEIQFAQNVGQSFLGINLKCASCHDSFVDRWKLADAYGLAAIYAERPLELHRCDKPTGKMAEAAWLFPELGQIDPAASQPERLKQLAMLMTHRENGRFTRTIVNRLWHRLMGHGIVHPTDSMQSPPWNADLLDYLAEHLADNHYDLKETLALMATSEAYQSQAEQVTERTDADGYQYAGPRSKRMTAEQFVDGIWQITGTAPTEFDAPIVRGKPTLESASTAALGGSWIWNRTDTSQAAAGETISLRKVWELDQPASPAFAVISCDNAYTMYVNGKQVAAGDNWETPDLVLLPPLKQGVNEILVVAKNGGNGPNPAGLFLEAHAGDAETALVTDGSWQWTFQLPAKSGKFSKTPDDWQPASVVAGEHVWMGRLQPQLIQLVSQGLETSPMMVRASLLKSDFLMRSLGRPNRDQVVSVRPLELSTLVAIELSNGETLANILHQGAIRLQDREWESPDAFVTWLFQFALSRDPSPAELTALSSSLGSEMSTEAIEDVLWAVLMLPEFQLVH